MNEQNNLYELRNDEVKSVLNRPPATLIIWGNLIVFILIICFFFLASKITIPKHISADYIIQGNAAKQPLIAIEIITTLPTTRHPYSQKTNIKLISAQNQVESSFLTDSSRIINGRIHLYGRLLKADPFLGNRGKLVEYLGKENLLSSLYRKAINL